MQNPFKSPSFARIAAKIEANLSTNGITALFLAVYITSVALTFLWGFWTEFVKPQNTQIRWYIGLARSAGYSLNLNTALVLLLASRLFLTALRDSALSDILPLDKAFPALHIVVAYVIIISVVIHVPFHFVWIVGWNKWSGGLWQVNMTVITGCVLLLIFLVLVVFALPWVRRRHFKLFYTVHLIGATLFFIILIFHGMYEGRPETYKWVTAPLIVYLADRVVRLLSVSAHRVELSVDNSSFKDDNILQLSIPKPFKFRPGQYAEIKVPSINREWHPFTIASAEYESNMSFYIKLLGDWTQSLHKGFQDQLSGNTDEPLEVFVRGPFGAPTQHVDKYSRIFLISGGIGATPFASICKQLHHLHEEHDARIHSHHRPRRDEPITDDATENRIKQTVKNIYDVDTDVAPGSLPESRGDGAPLSHHMDYVTDMLRVATLSGQIISDPQHNNSNSESPLRESDETTNTKEFIDEESLNITAAKDKIRSKLRSALKKPTILSKDAKMERQKQSRLGDRRGTCLLVLHSSRLTFLLAVICIARMAVSICGSIFGSGFVFLHEPVATGRWIALVYAVLSTPLAIISVVTVLLELSVHSNASFSSTRRILEFVMFLPVSVTLTVLEFRRWAKNDPGGPVFIFIQYVLAQSVTFVLVVGRMWRAVGRRGLLDDGHHSHMHDRSHNHIPHADFVWTMSDDSSDTWLRREMMQVTMGGAVTVHRYITRGTNRNSLADDMDILDAEEGRRVSIALEEATKSGRPNWDNLLSAAARQTRSDGVVGIFFCGPKKMGSQVQASAQRVEMWSNLKDAYLRSVNVNTLVEEIGLTDESAALRLRDFGCRIRFVYHEENFS